MSPGDLYLAGMQTGREGAVLMWQRKDGGRKRTFIQVDPPIYLWRTPDAELSKGAACTFITRRQWQICFYILLIASLTKAILCKKINRWEKKPLKCRCVSHKCLCVFVLLHCEQTRVIAILSLSKEHWHFHKLKMDTSKLEKHLAITDLVF